MNQSIDYGELKSCLMSYYHSFEKLTKLLGNSNIVGTYSEKIVCDTLGLTKQPDSHKFTDAKGTDGKTYQIKSRWNKSFLRDKSGQNEFGSFAYCESNYPFDFLILVYYENDLLHPKVFQIESLNINLLLGDIAQKKNNRVIVRYNNAFKQAVKNTPYICDISDQFKSIFINRGGKIIE